MPVMPLLLLTFNPACIALICYDGIYEFRENLVLYVLVATRFTPDSCAELPSRLQGRLWMPSTPETSMRLSAYS